MLKRRPLEQKAGHERWLVSYADFITLLFAFFVVMYSISQVNEEKYRTLAETLNIEFSESGAEIGGSEENIAGDDRIVELDKLVNSIQERLNEFPVDGRLSMSANENWVELTLSTEMLFASGSVIPKKEAQAIFSDLADMLAPYANEIQIIGHTDDVPINTSEFRNNWSLSSGRAISVVNYLAFEGIAPQRMSAIAYGEYRPIADNTTEDGRRQNRRVVVRIAGHGVETEQNALDNSIVNLAVSRDVEVEAEVDQESSVQTVQEEGVIQPVRLKGGDLLFTADPDLPRLRELDEE